MQNNLFNNGNQMGLEMQIHQAFLNTPEGRAAEQDFANAKRAWWERLNNPHADQVQPNQASEARLNEVEAKIDQILTALSANNKKD